MAQNIIIAFAVGFVTNLLTNWLWDWFRARGWLKKLEDTPTSETSMSGVAKRLAVTGWGMLPLGYIIVALYLIEHRWPLTLTEISLLLAVGFLVNLVLLAIGMLISVGWLKVSWSLGLMLIVIASEMGTLYLLDRSLPHHIAMDCPREVESLTVIPGRLINRDSQVYLLIEPEIAGSFYVMDPAYPGEDGIWFARGNFDGVAGAKYKILAVALQPAQLPQGKPNPDWLIRNAPWRTSICAVIRK